MTHSGLTNLSIVYHAADSLRPYANNARAHSKRQIRQIADSIKALQPSPRGSQEDVIAGHGRVEAAKLLGTTNIPTIELSELSEDEVRAYILADNKLAEKAVGMKRSSGSNSSSTWRSNHGFGGLTRYRARVVTSST